MRELPSDLRRKAEGLLHVYGGFQGLARNPPWLVAIVLKTWFTDAERKELVKYLAQGVKRDLRSKMMKELWIS